MDQRTHPAPRLAPLPPEHTPELWMIGRSAPFDRASRMLAISKVAISQSNIARPILALTDCRQ
jgi:hypothetical protein